MSMLTFSIYLSFVYLFIYIYIFVYLFIYLLASERSERDTLRSVQSRFADIIYYIYIVRAIFVLITRKEGGA